MTLGEMFASQLVALTAFTACWLGTMLYSILMVLNVRRGAPLYAYMFMLNGALNERGQRYRRRALRLAWAGCAAFVLFFVPLF